MKEISKHIGQQIRMYRKVQGLTLQQLATLIYKKRATVSKYETDEIALDVETLYKISKVLHVNVNQLINYQPEEKKNRTNYLHPVLTALFLRPNDYIFIFMTAATTA